eukprot:TRINITY_DN56589_c0_g1_i1.p1 TRINITY_DN56589_c0_g1~~TRINITY_DN56589_c0_g1_i1.p1  ORF type:complete len:651 (-),score=92.48 TRINITY_DN56589_c0_g1_i1:155-1885(-)
MVPANVVTHMRIVAAVSAFCGSAVLGAGTKGPKLSANPQLFPYLFDVSDNNPPSVATTHRESGGEDCTDQTFRAVPEDQEKLNEIKLPPLNANQSLAVIAAGSSCASLVHGPPGTGKTTVAASIVLDTLQTTDNRILVCAETHIAVENLAERLLDLLGVADGVADGVGGDYGSMLVRVGGRTTAKGSSGDPSIALESIRLENRVRLLNKKAAGAKRFFLTRYKTTIRSVLGQARVVFTTCAGAGDPVLSGCTFHSVIMDEGSMTTQPTSLCALAHGCKHLVLIGDPKQLGPHAKLDSSSSYAESFFDRLLKSAERLRVKSSASDSPVDESNSAEDVGARGLGAGSVRTEATSTSSCVEQQQGLPIVEHLESDSSMKKKYHIPKTLLNEQHRMHPSLCKFPSRFFYDGQLETPCEVEQRNPVPWPFFGEKNAIRFVEVRDGKEERLVGGSWFNEVEVRKVVSIVGELLFKQKEQQGLVSTQITVLTPYRAQQLKIVEQFKSSRSRPEVCSVDAFQGRENDVIIVSTVRCRDSLGFCDDERRLNVSLTRAKRGLIVVGHRGTLAKSEVWSSWLKELQD